MKYRHASKPATSTDADAIAASFELATMHATDKAHRVAKRERDQFDRDRRRGSRTRFDD